MNENKYDGIMISEGTLVFDDNAEYILKTQEKDLNLNSTLNQYLMDSVFIYIHNTPEDGKIALYGGILTLENDLGGNIYRYWVTSYVDNSKHCLDDLLFKISSYENNKIKFEIEVIG